LPKTVIGAQLGIDSGAYGVVWKFVCGIVAPLAVMVVFVSTLID
jgi:hypothetical protein